MNLEPPYEDHVAYHSKRPFSTAEVRKRLAWSLLVSPTAGVTYGGHGVWAWDDGQGEPMNHPGTGVPKPWAEAVRMPGAEQLVHLRRLFDGMEWWRLRPLPALVAEQPGGSRFVDASATDDARLALVYVPEDRVLTLTLDLLPVRLEAIWIDPVDGTLVPAGHVAGCFTTPAEGDWWLRLRGQPVAVPSEDLPRLTAEQVRETL